MKEIGRTAVGVMGLVLLVIVGQLLVAGGTAYLAEAVDPNKAHQIVTEQRSCPLPSQWQSPPRRPSPSAAPGACQCQCDCKANETVHRVVVEVKVVTVIDAPVQSAPFGSDGVVAAPLPVPVDTRQICPSSCFERPVAPGCGRSCPVPPFTPPTTWAEPVEVQLPPLEPTQGVNYRTDENDDQIEGTVYDPPYPPVGSESDPAYEASVRWEGEVGIVEPAPVYLLPKTYIDNDVTQGGGELNITAPPFDVRPGEEFAAAGDIVIRFVNPVARSSKVACGIE